ncbi:MAG: hypothetical protein A2126_00545 [Candidatus Woykebacteria bacterium GWB1_45_5]|uniref:Phage holin family protein n=1 Tax=Candidatus Woykebacteria bacterium GWB1_45_5 TaxID=1802592 RepID=A0A1G1W845_9BACT|nr:MAG: hypothetical protein A2126_00545 [Candidatus Woykebacteria bacterium GWB1_45_5]
MKKMLRSAALASISFLILAYFYPGFSFAGPNDRVVAALIFAGFYLFLRPALKLLSIPLNLITFGLFSLFINVLLLYLLTFAVSGFEIVAFNFSGVSFAGFNIPGVYLPSFPSAIVAAAALSFLASLLFWIFA